VQVGQNIGVESGYFNKWQHWHIVVQVGQNLGAESGYELLETQVLLGCMLVSAALPEYDSVEKMALGRLAVSDEPKNVGNFAISSLAVMFFTIDNESFNLLQRYWFSNTPNG
jgi:hypothetical protein